MTCIVFKNKGEIDTRAITIMGVSAKISPDAIGFFGTGLKFSIATLLRNGMKIVIYSGLRKLEFTTQAAKMRDKEFNLILMNGKELGYATDTGRTWQMWQAFRELYCNCIDEGGSAFEADEAPEPESGTTTIIVTGGLIVEQFRNKGAIFIEENETPLQKSSRAEVYDPAKQSGIFYRKVKVKDRENTLYKYNILDKIDLTEDRTAKYDFQVLWAIRDTVVKSDNPHFIEKMVTAKHPFFESSINYSEACHPSQVFLDTVRRIYDFRRADLVSGVWELYKKYAPWQSISDPVILSETEKKQLFKACELAEKMGFPVRDYPIHTFETLGDGILALAQTNPDKEILLTREIYTKGILYLARGLIEEYLHLRHGFDDCTREMQNYIFDKMVHFGMIAVGEVA